MEERASEMMWRMEGGLMGRDESLEEGMEERFNQHTTTMNERFGKVEEKVDKMEENQQRMEENQQRMEENQQRMEENQHETNMMLQQILTQFQK